MGTVPIGVLLRWCWVKHSRSCATNVGSLGTYAGSIHRTGEHQVEQHVDLAMQEEVVLEGALDLVV